MSLSNELSCEAGRFSCFCLNPHRSFQSEVWGFISPRWSPGLGGLRCSLLFIPVYLCANVGPQGATLCSACPFSATLSPALSVYLRECGAAGSALGRTACSVSPTLCQSRSPRGRRVLSTPAARLHPSYWSGCRFLFYLLGVGLPCCLIFCQFWLCEEAQCVYLCHHLGSPVRIILKISQSDCGFYLFFLIVWSVFTLHTLGQSYY